MEKIKIITVLGTRPEVIKLAPVIAALEKQRGKIICRAALTGQHRSMARQFLDLFSVTPDYDLKIMSAGQTLFDVSRKCLERLPEVLEKEKPDLILVEGDTTTAFIAGLCAFYLKIPVGHVEAGLRTYDKYRPFPEEVNRRLLTAVADLHFAPTQKAKENLLREGIDKKTIHVTGNTVIDAVLSVAAKTRRPKMRSLENIDFCRKKVILVTAHRRESFGGPFREICRAIKKISAFPGVEVIYPVHLNPNVQTPVYNLLNGRQNIHLLEPLDYESFVYCLKRCYLVLSDSGGVQEEAPAFGKPILVMREVTERPEGVEAGVAKLVGMDAEKITRETKRLLTSQKAYQAMARAVNPYGDGRAAERIAGAVLKYFRGK